MSMVASMNHFFSFYGSAVALLFQIRLPIYFTFAFFSLFSLSLFFIFSKLL
jgi:hypothetical protein